MAKIAKGGGADFLEVGDPLIKSQGAAAISKIKQAAPEVPIVAEMMSADWGQDQIELAALFGRSIVDAVDPKSAIERCVSSLKL